MTATNAGSVADSPVCTPTPTPIRDKLQPFTMACYRWLTTDAASSTTSTMRRQSPSCVVPSSRQIRAGDHAVAALVWLPMVTGCLDYVAPKGERGGSKASAFRSPWSAACFAAQGAEGSSGADGEQCSGLARVPAHGGVVAGVGSTGARMGGGLCLVGAVAGCGGAVGR
jgi:hypothetical protein